MIGQICFSIFLVLIAYSENTLKVFYRTVDEENAKNMFNSIRRTRLKNINELGEYAKRIRRLT